MKSMVKRFIIFFIFVFIGISFVGITVNAETEYVDDCLENPESCGEPEPLSDSEVQTDDEESELLGQELKGSSLLFEIIKMFFALLLVLALIYIFLYFLKRRNKLGNRIKSLENIGGISVGQNKSVQIIRLGSRIYLIGVGEDITLLEEIKDEVLINELMSEMEEAASDFNTDTILSIFQRKNANKKEKNTDFKQLFNQELNSLQKKRKNIINRHKEDHHE